MKQIFGDIIISLSNLKDVKTKFNVKIFQDDKIKSYRSITYFYPLLSFTKINKFELFLKPLFIFKKITSTMFKCYFPSSLLYAGMIYNNLHFLCHVFILCFRLHVKLPSLLALLNLSAVNCIETRI